MAAWSDYDVELRLRRPRRCRCTPDRLVVRAPDHRSGYRWTLDPESGLVESTDNTVTNESLAVSVAALEDPKASCAVKNIFAYVPSVDHR